MSLKATCTKLFHNSISENLECRWDWRKECYRAHLSSQMNHLLQPSSHLPLPPPPTPHSSQYPIPSPLRTYIFNVIWVAWAIKSLWFRIVLVFDWKCTVLYKISSAYYSLHFIPLLCVLDWTTLSDLETFTKIEFLSPQSCSRPFLPVIFPRHRPFIRLKKTPYFLRSFDRQR